jgi:hypothetical protein
VTTRSFNDLLRSRARSTTRTPDHEGSIGIGIGGAGYAPRARTTNREINDAIREAARLATNRFDLDGVSLDDVWRR